jgi:SAM-dependent methyltransferase
MDRRTPGEADDTAKRFWEASFKEQVARQAYNTAPVEAVIRTVSYHLRERFPDGQPQGLHFLEMGCGAGPNLIWLAQRGMTVSGVDICATALALAQEHLQRAGCAERVGRLIEGSASQVPFEDGTLDGVIEACVFQHLGAEERRRAFREVVRLLKPGGVFVGYMLAVGHTVFEAKQAEQAPDDPGTVWLDQGGSTLYLTNAGLCHFYRKDELHELLEGCSTVDPCPTDYRLPQFEARKRGYAEYLQRMWTVYAVK